MGGEPKDFDIEVYGIAYDQLAGILARHGRVDLVGKSFGVVKLSLGKTRAATSTISAFPAATASWGSSIAIFRPRLTRRSRRAKPPADATSPSTRWLTIRWPDELLDFFGGAEDLKNRVLRATSDAFAEDPLRVLRGMQFACRFDLTLDPGTAAMCQTIVDHYATIARERVADEFMKWAVKSSRPGRIAEYLKASGWDVHFPEIARLSGVPQDPGWHPEGDVGTHTMFVVDAAARIAARENVTGDDRAVLIFAALSHDFAKATTTMLREREGKMRWTSWGHEADGGPMARTFLDRIGIKSAITDRVVPMVENHLASSSIGREATPRAVRRLAMRLAPATITDLLRLIEADYSGRPPLPTGLPEGAIRIREMAEAQAVDHGPQAPLILGRHVMPYFDDQPGKHIGEVTAAAYEAQADGAFSNQEEALQWLERYMARESTG